MSVQVHVEGQISYGRFADFVQAVRAYVDYSGSQENVTPEVLQGISGLMNTLRLVYRYGDLAEYERYEARTGTDRECGRLASAMPFMEGSIACQIYSGMPNQHVKGDA